MSPFTTLRSPVVKSDAENRVPVLYPEFGVLALLLAKNAPPTVAVALMLNTAKEAEFVATDGLAVVAATKVQDGRVALL